LAAKRQYTPVNSERLLRIEHAHIHNLQDVSVDIPLGLLVGVAGVSGSGKSSLIHDTLVPLLKEHLKNKLVYDTDEEIFVDTTVLLEGFEQIRKCIVVDQKPIGRSKTSCPATYTGLLNRIRKLFANTPEAIERGYTAGLFTVNSKGGCRTCKGEGVIRYHVGFGNFIDLNCNDCSGTGFVEEARTIHLDGKTILDVLAMSVSEAADFFGRSDSPAYDARICGRICAVLNTLERVGLGYITLGQKTPTISGGEAQRIKLAKELAKRSGKNTVYVLDEPTTGLAFADIKRLIDVMQQLVDAGNTLIVTEHDPAVLSNCDYIIEMGPGGGNDGGYVIATGTPQALRASPHSIIGKYLK
jgi:excinuclease ABC A subunit